MYERIGVEDRCCAIWRIERIKNARLYFEDAPIMKLSPDICLIFMDGIFRDSPRLVPVGPAGKEMPGQ
jgi:hypothetical protein